MRKQAEKLQHELDEGSEERTRLRTVESGLKEEVQNLKTENVKLRKDLNSTRGQSAQVKELERQVAQQKSEIRTLQMQRQEHAKEKEALLQINATGPWVDQRRLGTRTAYKRFCRRSRSLLLLGTNDLDQSDHGYCYCSDGQRKCGG